MIAAAIWLKIAVSLYKDEILEIHSSDNRALVKVRKYIFSTCVYMVHAVPLWCRARWEPSIIRYEIEGKRYETPLFIPHLAISNYIFNMVMIGWQRILGTDDVWRAIIRFWFDHLGGGKWMVHASILLVVLRALSHGMQSLPVRR